MNLSFYLAFILFCDNLTSVLSRSFLGTDLPSHQLSPFINYYEPVLYEILPQAKIYKINSSSPLDVTTRLLAFNQNFDLHLQKDSDTLASWAEIIVHGKNWFENVPPSVIRDNLMKGHVDGQSGSTVHGIIYEGIFDGVIHLPMQNDTYYVEPASVYFDDPVPFASIMYRAQDLNRTALLCSKDTPNECRPYRLDDVNNLTNPQHMYRTTSSDGTMSPFWKNINFSKSIFTKGSGGNICTLKVVADHTYFKNVAHENVTTALLQIVTLIQRTNEIFRLADWDSDGIADNTRLQVTSVHLWLTSESPEYNLKNEHLSSNNFLTTFSENDFSSHCLGVALVSRIFADKVVGLAYTANADGIGAGGICAPRRKWYGGLSVNTAFASISKASERMPKIISVITLTHELGHSFGSFHDDPSNDECSPTEEHGGNFIMAPFAVSGIESNNLKFSPCSRRVIAQVLHKRSYCFIKETNLAKQLCGNGIIDDGEECDCGEKWQCDQIDPCCSPKGDVNACRLQGNAECSPRQGICCNSSCHFVKKAEYLRCNNDSHCEKPSYCNGLQSTCTPGHALAEGAPCRGGLGVCASGQCVQMVCLASNLDDCDCSQLRLSCYVCCRRQGLCLPAYFYGIMAAESKPFLKPQNEPCDHGYGRCRGKTCEIFDHLHIRQTAGEDGTNDYDYKPTVSQDDLILTTKITICSLVVGCALLFLAGIWCISPSSNAPQSELTLMETQSSNNSNLNNNEQTSVVQSIAETEVLIHDIKNKLSKDEQDDVKITENKTDEFIIG